MERDGTSYRRQEGEYMLFIDPWIIPNGKDWDARIEVCTEIDNAPREVWCKSFQALGEAMKAVEAALQTKPWESR